MLRRAPIGEANFLDVTCINGAERRATALVEIERRKSGLVARWLVPALCTDFDSDRSRLPIGRAGDVLLANGFSPWRVGRSDRFLGTAVEIDARPDSAVTGRETMPLASEQADGAAVLGRLRSLATLLFARWVEGGERRFMVGVGGMD